MNIYLEHIMLSMIPFFVHILEIMGIFIIVLSAFKTFIKYAFKFFDFSDERIKIALSRSLAIALEFKLAAEILKTLMIRTFDELIILASIIVLRIALTFVIHWEIESDTKMCK